jgi:hypothetical protein
MIIGRVKAGMSFDQAVAEVEGLCGFKCEQWWLDLNRKVITESARPPTNQPDPKKKG